MLRAKRVNVSTKISDKTKGIMWFLAQCITVPITICFVRLASEGTPLLVVILLQNIMSFLMLGGYMLVKRTSIKTKKLKLHAIRNVFGLSSWVCLFYAFNNMQLNVVTAITFTGPLVGTLLAAIFLKEKLHRHRIEGLLVGFAGMLVLLHPEAGAFNEYGLLALTGVITLCITLIIFNILNRTEKQIVIVFYMTLFSTLMIAPPALLMWQTPSMESLFWTFLIAVFAIFNVFAMVSAVKNAGIGTLMPFDFTRLVMTAILAYFVFDEKLDWLTALGAVIILSAAVYVVKQEKRVGVSR